jgi:hypothetical protein
MSAQRNCFEQIVHKTPKQAKEDGMSGRKQKGRKGREVRQGDIAQLTSIVAYRVCFNVIREAHKARNTMLETVSMSCVPLLYFGIELRDYKPPTCTGAKSQVGKPSEPLIEEWNKEI